jgi:hypothetical protein
MSEEQNKRCGVADVPNETVVPLTQEQQIMVNAVVFAIKEELKHECFFSSKERKRVHDFVDAVGDVDASRSTHIIILRAGKAMEDVTKKLSTAILWVVIIAFAGLLTLFFGKPLVELLQK